MPIALLSQTNLFAGLSPQQIAALLTVLQPVRRSCTKGEILLERGCPCAGPGVVLSGQVGLWRPLPEGDCLRMARLGPGGVFGEALCGGLPSPVTVRMDSPGEVLLLDCTRFFLPPLQTDDAGQQLLRNLLAGAGRSCCALLEQVELLTLKSLRSKICTYLLRCAARAGADTFSVPHSRAELAAYLGCDRSALSRELSHLQAEGYLETYKNSFKILDRPRMEHLGLA